MVTLASTLKKEYGGANVKAETRANITADAKVAEAKQPPQPTLADWLELLKQLTNEAVAQADYAGASKLMQQASKLQAASKAAELVAKADAVAQAKAKLEQKLHNIIVAELGDLWNLCDGYWVSYDKLAQPAMIAVSLFKAAKATRASSNGGASKRYSTTATLLTAYGDVQAQHLLDKYGISLSWQQAYDQRIELAATHRHGDTKNFLHTDVHKAMLKVAGEI